MYTALLTAQCFQAGISAQDGLFRVEVPEENSYRIDVVGGQRWISLGTPTVDAGYIWLAIILGLNSAIAVYYYLKLIVYMFLMPAVDNTKTVHNNRSLALEMVIGIAVLATVASLFYVQPLMHYIMHMISASGY